MSFQETAQADRLIFLDEDSKNNITRLQSRSRRGLRCHDAAPIGLRRWRKRLVQILWI